MQLKKRKLMKAMIFAAGLGTRLRPLTNNKPKALVEYKGKTLLEICIRKIINSGFDEIIINVHHFAGQIIKLRNEMILSQNSDEEARITAKIKSKKIWAKILQPLAPLLEKGFCYVRNLLL